jgi:hypothetical protein
VAEDKTAFRGSSGSPVHIYSQDLVFESSRKEENVNVKKVNVMKSLETERLRDCRVQYSKKLYEVLLKKAVIFKIL